MLRVSQVGMINSLNRERPVGLMVCKSLGVVGLQGGRAQVVGVPGPRQTKLEILIFIPRVI